MLKVVNTTGVVLAFLNNLTLAEVNEAINGEYTINFIATIDPLKTDHLYDENNLIEYSNDLFRVVQLEELHSDDDGISISVMAEHISYDSIKNIMPNFNYKNQSAAYVMLKCFENTDFRFIGTDITDFKTDIQYTEECNSKQISVAIANNWRGELKYFRRDIELVKERGQNRGVDFRFGKNTHSIKRIINFGEKTVAYEVNVEQGSEFEELGYFELGDTIRVIDNMLKIDMYVRIVDLTKDILTGLNSTVVLGDKIKDLRSTFSNTETKIKEALDKVNDLEEKSTDWDEIKNIVDEQGNVIAGKLSGTLNTANTLIQNLTGTMKWTGNTLMCTDQPTEEKSKLAIELGAGGLRIANAKNSDGTWRWRTAITGEGLVADSVSAGAIDGLTLNAVTLVSTEITSGTITGVTIKGCRIIGGDESGVYTLISQDSPLGIYSGRNQLAEIWSDGSGGSHLKLKTVLEGVASEKLILRAGGDYAYIIANDSQLTFSASGSGAEKGRFKATAQSGFFFYTGFQNTLFRITDLGDVSLGKNGRYTDILGYVNIPDLNVSTLQSKSISELEVTNMELEQRLINEGIARSELEVTLMEKGVL